MTHPEILQTEKLGGRELLNIFLGCCANCGTITTAAYDEACFDENNNVFCSEECFKKYYGYKGVDEIGQRVIGI